MVLEELRTVFISELADTTYIPILKQIDLNSLELALKNLVFIIKLMSRDYNNKENRTTSDSITNYVYELKITLNTFDAWLYRVLVWLATGQSFGYITVFDSKN
ncbi:hypothetical protein FQR65_LT12343 [Abscondita terminalis]|nr:hypothetical protein FQR65_LT12343 [Abscondita terminalis]